MSYSSIVGYEVIPKPRGNFSDILVAISQYSQYSQVEKAHPIKE